MALVGIVILLVIVGCTVAAPIIAPYSPYKVDTAQIAKPPSRSHWLGTDTAGRDVLSRLLYGGRVSLPVGLLASTVSIGIGVVLGLVSGFLGKAVDFWLMRVVDVVMTIPTLIIVITVVSIIGPNMRNIILVLGVLGWTGTCRLVRGQTLSVRERDFVLAARCMGAQPWRIMLRHILPNVMAPAIVAGTFALAANILAEAGLSFLGLGVRPPTPTWGNMLSAAQRLITLERQPWLWVPPGVVITLVVLAINFIGDALRDALDPRLIMS
jgi:peptide/nickel transport system permease protein